MAGWINKFLIYSTQEYYTVMEMSELWLRAPLLKSQKDNIESKKHLQKNKQGIILFI